MKTVFIVAVLFMSAQAQLLRSDHLITTPIDHTSVESVQLSVDVLSSAPKYPSSRIASGFTAAPGQIPYQAALYLNGRSFCGGSLISTRWVLTAAHCASGISAFTVYLGTVYLNYAQEEGRVITETTTKIVHPSYSALLIANDIAVINLNQDIHLTEFIQPVALASGSDLYDGAIARASGWGKVSDASTSVSSQLMYVDLYVISNVLCRQTFGIYIRSSSVCTQGVAESGVCNGDSGGPLVELESGKQIGIASFVSSAGCQSGDPNGFARVSSFADWISQNTGIAI